MFSDPKRIIDQFVLGKGTTVADFGAGSGFYAMAAAEAVGEAGRVYAIDIQKDLLDKLRNEAKNVRHLRNLEVLWADIEHVGGTRLRDGSVDAVIAANALFQVANKDGACMEMKRILKQNGRALVVDWSASFGGVGPHPKDVFSEDAAKALFAKHGFKLDKEIISSGAQHYGLVFRK